VIEQTDVSQDGAQAIVSMRQVVLQGQSAFEICNRLQMLKIFRGSPKQKGAGDVSFGKIAVNLERSTVVAPVNGIATNFGLLPGRYVNAGAAVFALIDSDTFRVEGYFEETKLRRIRIGEDATVKLIGDARVLSGHVESIAYGIEDQNRSTSSDLLAFVNPTFSWVRLAQRIPVRIKLDNVPPDLLLVAGRTATVSIGKISWW